MQYKTIILELIRSRQELHHRLKASKTLLSTVERYAILLKASHETWIESMRDSRPETESSQLSSEALEIALKAFEEALLNGSVSDEAETLSLDDAMALLSHRKPAS